MSPRTCSEEPSFASRLHSAALPLPFGVLLRGRHGLRWLTTGVDGALLVRRLLLLALAIPLLVTWFATQAEENGWLGERAGLFASAGTNMMVSATLVLVTALWLRRSEQGRRQAQDDFRTLSKDLLDFKAALDEHAIVATTDPQGRITFVNDRFCAISKYSRAELLGQDHRLINSGHHSKRFMGEMWETIKRGEVWRGELRNRAKDGSFYWVQTTIVPMLDADGRLRQYVAIRADITERKRAEETLRQSEERFRELANKIEEVFLITDPQSHQLHYVSLGLREDLGVSGETAISSAWKWLDAIHPDDRKRIQLAAQTKQEGGHYDEIYRIVRPDGSVRWIHDRAYPVKGEEGRVVRVIGIAADITQRHLLELQLRQAQKMESIGQLAGGIAHDFNNLLTVIQGHANLLLDLPECGRDLRESAEQISLAAERSAALTRQLLTFSRKQAMQAAPLNLNDAVRDFAKMLKRILGADVVLEVRCAAELPPVHADVAMLEQVLMNLVVNARDAMPAGGKLFLRTKLQVLNAEHLHLQARPQAKPGEYVCLEVEDTGCGISQANLTRIFEPFFTTKEVGRGTGLGLATVYGIIEQHRGWLTVYSEVGLGTVFRVYLPALSSFAEKPKELAAIEMVGGHETILLVEDEPPLRMLVRDLLERLGYTVYEAGSGPEAEKIFQEFDGRIDLLLTDVIMPGGITGFELAKKLRVDRSDLAVLYTSGYSQELVCRDQQLQEGVNFLQKPHPPRLLAESVRAAIDSRLRQ
ncbi:MAG: PAS domain-containing protein [Verrucomicrobiota bacterium]